MLPSSWKRDIASGLIVLVPLLVTAYVLAFLYRFVAGLPINFGIEYELYGVGFEEAIRVALILAVFASLVVSTGYLMRTTAGDLVERLLDDLMNRVPGLRVVYNASKMAIETAVSGGSELQTPVKIETWPGMRMTGFKTGKTTADGRDIVFLPTAPNITTGFVVELEPEDYEVSDETVEDALTRILSAGFGEETDDGLVALGEFGDDEADEGAGAGDPGVGPPPADDGGTPPDDDGDTPSEGADAGDAGSGA